MNRTKSFHIQTFGCQMNERDSETLAGMLVEMGYVPAGKREDAQVAIINTCSVREHADERFFGTLGQLKKIKESRPDFVVCICGCMMQQQHVIDKVKSSYPWVDIIFGTHNIHRFPDLLEKTVTEKEKQTEIWPGGGEVVEGLPSKRLYRHKAFVNIMYGCNNFCTYCIVPYTRGRERSRTPEAVMDEIRNLAADGVKEITLLGQNVNSYRGGGGRDFADLLYMIDEVDGIDRVRFMTSHPKDISDRLIQAYADCDSLCSHIHLPVQSGSDDVLARMNRKYTAADYLTIIEKLRKARPDIAVTTDIIVGFPGETEEDFRKTLSLCEKVGFDSAFTFIYSVRKGTPAEEFSDQIPEFLKHERFNRLVEIINKSSAEKNKAREGKIEKVLADGPSKSDETVLTGRTEGFKPVNFQGGNNLVGTILDVEITEGKTFSLQGRIRQQES
ncbi:MAG: tRNA (N6-isopentenyl adenosine(37)-C2)-methylthiotransferase MiaB [Eubacteriaceae bacterium]|nr:tRNA (N6-isopentenyl adenosine(37)-C2)-methylthiotransferase MiaB [Eubacteriaceae bacterium]